LLETPYSTPKTDKGTAVNTFLQVGATDSWANSNLITTYLPWLPSNSIP
jgi:hypothetical protein